MTMIISPYQPPGPIFFGSVAVVFVVMLVLLPRYLSRTAAAYWSMVWCLIPALAGLLWIHLVFHMISTSGVTGPVDTRELVGRILRMAWAGMGISIGMMAVCGLRFFAGQRGK